MHLKNKKVLITGSEGFIGSHLVEKLVELEAEVTAFVLYNSFNSWGWLDTLDEKYKKHIKVFTGDVRDENSIRKAVEDKEVVFHLAALIAIPYSYYAPSAYVDTNVKGTLNVLQSCRDFNVEKVIHTSTSEVYGTAQYVPIDEKHSLQGQSPYSASKIAADMMAESYYRSFETPVATIRPFNTYGPRQSARAVIPTIIAQILAGAKEIKLGSLTPTRDFNYVKDTVEGFIKVAESDRTIGRVTNIGTGKEISIGELAKKIISLTGRNVEIICEEERIRPEKSEVNRLCACNKKAMDDAGWKSQYSLDTGLIETIHWIEKNLQYFKSNIYNV
ncbi:NAD-dependent 4,6-dehydratase LegB [Clostridium formicaceticum]|uniref:GDP-6-deoxy-D-mannose reductase n=1 Tax=Clostridium formicaceticum TaxID=1497 RepID=A0AAC9WEP0_9CLOT|nr:NAD-dependent 4,6-dehydratase LegB [Clostridium formicaceticum]AOY75648.1 NAD-dependent dehydratase [Clostridium formicaceticum]ARE85962.1 GDP-6-deoxy-D-mannose reductase [Clostridium formicaceticum]